MTPACLVRLGSCLLLGFSWELLLAVLLLCL